MRKLKKILLRRCLPDGDSPAPDALNNCSVDAIIAWDAREFCRILPRHPFERGWNMFRRNAGQFRKLTDKILACAI